MSCQRHRPAIRAVALGGAVAADLEEHLASCPSCLDRVAIDQRLLARIDSGIEELLSVEASPGFMARVRARLEASEARPGALAHRWWLPVALGAAALFAAVSLAGRVPHVPSRVTPRADTIPSALPEATGNEAARVISAPLSDTAAASSSAIAPEAQQTMPPAGIPALQAATASPAGSVGRMAPRSRSPPPRVAPEVLIPSGDGEAVPHFVAGRHQWQLAGESLYTREFETLDAPSVADWEEDTSESLVVFNWELDAWPLAPSE